MPSNKGDFLVSMVPVEGIEPTLLAEHDFESCASTSSATRASRLFYSFQCLSGKRKNRNAPPASAGRKSRGNVNGA